MNLDGCGYRPCAYRQQATRKPGNWPENGANATSTQGIAAQALLLFRQENFVYTLQPPLLGNNSVDQFLFETRRGFCALRLRLRLPDARCRYPRQSGGWLSGRRNQSGSRSRRRPPVGRPRLGRNLDRRTWLAACLPDRSHCPFAGRTGYCRSIAGGETLPVMARVDLDWLRQIRYRWEAINNNWNQWVLGYNPERQREVLSRFGLGNIDWRGMTVLLSARCALALLGIAIWTLWQRPRDPAQKIWLRFCARLAGQGIPRQPWEGPIAYAERVAVARPEYGGIAHQAATAYAAVRYGDANEHRLQRLREALRQIPNTWRFF